MNRILHFGRKIAGVELLSAVSPHPDPLPQGEGITLSRSRMIQWSVAQSSIWIDCVRALEPTDSAPIFLRPGATAVYCTGP
jgi:hypothetical protein